MLPRLPPTNWMVCDPAAAVRVPPQLLTNPGADPPATANPAGNVPGRVSVNPIPLKATLPVFLIVMVRDEKLPARMGLGAKFLLILAPGRFVKVAAASCGFVAPLNVVTAPAGIVLVRLPLTVMVVLRVNVQFPAAGRLPPLNENVLAPGTPMIVPPHVPTFRLDGLAIMIPASGSAILSVKAIPVRGVLLGFVNTTLNVEDAPPVTESGRKPFTTVMERGAMVRVATAFAIG